MVPAVHRSLPAAPVILLALLAPAIPAPLLALALMAPLAPAMSRQVPVVPAFHYPAPARCLQAPVAHCFPVIPAFLRFPVVPALLPRLTSPHTCFRLRGCD